MNIVCAQCGAGVGYGLPSLADQAVLVCPGCRSGLRVRIEAFSIATPSPEAAPLPASSAGDQRHRAVVALHGEATRELIGELLSGEGFEVIEATTGAEALARVGAVRPALLLVDVGLSDIMGFQVCETIRKDAANAGMKVILVAAIHNKDRYRRQPDHLFGADDYIERHRIETDLVAKVKALCGGEASTAPNPPSDLAAAVATSSASESKRQAQAADVSCRAAADAPATPAAARPQSPTPAPIAAIPPATPRVAPATTASASPNVRSVPPPAPSVVREPSIPPVASPTVSAPKTADPAQEAARRLARIIVSDIALYNAKKVDEGVLKGTFFDLLRAEIDEGRRLYEERRDPSLQGTADLFQETLEQFVATRRELLNRNRPAAA